MKSIKKLLKENFQFHKVLNGFITFALIYFSLKRLFKILRNTLFIILGLAGLMIILINLGPVQNFLVQRASKYLSHELKTDVSIKHVRIHFFNSLDLEGLFIQDEQKDTLIYAGGVNARLTDWIFGGKQKTIHELKLKNTQVLLHRFKNEPKWNFSFITDKFGSKEKKKDKKSSQLDLALEQLSLQQVRVLLKDEWAGKNLEWKAGDLDLRPDNIDLIKKRIDLGKLKVKDFTFGITKYKGGRPPSPDTGPSPIDTTPFNKNDWAVTMNQLQIKNSHFYLERPSSPVPPGRFDADHINITGINADFENLKIDKDTVTGRIAFLQGFDRSGAAIKKMTADVTVSPKISECKNLYLNTGRSVLTDYYAMVYDRFPDFENYITRVKMVVHAKKAKIGIQDIVFFAPVMKRYADFTVGFDGNASGTVSNMSGKRLEVTDGPSSIIGDFMMVGLPDIDHTYMEVSQAEVHSTGEDALRFAPELKGIQTIQFTKLGQLALTGNFYGNYRDFRADGIFNSNLGSLSSDFKMQIPKNGQPAYQGNIRSEDFDFQNLLENDLLGKAGWDLDFEGSGFDPEHLNGKVKGQIHHFDFKGYNYTALDVNTNFKDKEISGEIHSLDPNATLDLEGKFNYAGKENDFLFNALVQNIDFKQLNLLDDSLTLSGNIKGTFQGNSINSLVGNALLDNVDLRRNHKSLNIKKLGVQTHVFSEDHRDLTLSMTGAEAYLDGDFRLSDFTNGIQMFLSYYIPGFVPAPRSIGKSHYFRFGLTTTEDISDALSVLHSKLKLQKNSQITGFLNLDEQQLSLEGDLNQFALGNINIEQAHLSGKGDYNGLDIVLDANSIHSTSARLLDHLNLNSRISRDTANFRIMTSSPTNTGDAVLNGQAYAVNDSLHLSMGASQFYFNNAAWDIAEGNVLTFGNNYLSINNLIITSGEQKIAINPKGSASLNGNHALVELEGIKVSPINNIIDLKDNKIGGTLSGTGMAIDLMDQTKLLFNLRINQASLKDDPMGTLVLKGRYSVPDKKLTLSEGTGLQRNHARLSIQGDLDLENTQHPLFEGSAQLKDAELAWATPFLENVAHNITGTANGTVVFAGNITQPTINGNIKMEKVSFIPNVTSVKYTLDNTNVKINSNAFSLDSTIIRDDFGNQGLLYGALTHHKLHNFNFNFTLRSPKIKAVHQTKYQNNIFYGDIDADVLMTIRGPWDNMTMRVTGTPLINSKLYLNRDYTSDNLGAFNFISFKAPQDTLGPINSRVKFANKFNFILDAVVNPNLETTLILDNETDEKIWAKGAGNILLQIPSEGDMKMEGNYVISEGTYDFTFQRLQVLNYRREFLIDENSTIKWNGAPLAADLDVTAHTTVQARLYDLISSERERLNLSDEEIHDAQLRQGIDILLAMKGSLNEPELSFKIKLAEGRSIGTYAYSKLQRLNTDEKQTLIQVSSLLLLGQFVPPEGINNSAISSGTINNMSEIVSSAASAQLSNFANKVLGMKDLSVGVKYKNYSLSEANQFNNLSYFNRNEAQLNLKKNFLNDRLMVEVGGAYDWGQAGAGDNYTSNLAGDFRIQYLLTPDGRVRVTIFRTSDYDPLYSLKTIGRQGASISYRKSFNNLRDFLGGRQRRLQLDAPSPLTEPQEDSTTGKKRASLYHFQRQQALNKEALGGKGAGE